MRHCAKTFIGLALSYFCFLFFFCCFFCQKVSFLTWGTFKGLRFFLTFPFSFAFLLLLIDGIWNIDTWAIISQLKHIYSWLVIYNKSNPSVRNFAPTKDLHLHGQTIWAKILFWTLSIEWPSSAYVYHFFSQYQILIKVFISVMNLLSLLLQEVSAR